MGRTKILISCSAGSAEEVAPFFLIKADKHPFLAYQYGSFHQHPVTAEQLKHLIIRKAAKFGFKLQRPIELATGVDKPSELQPASLVEGYQLFLARTFEPDVPVGR